jgi:hypothetical protein
MTKDILLSDVDLAERLIKAGRPDDEIIATLLKRGIEAGKAAKLVLDLRQGVQVAPEVYATPVMRESRSSHGSRSRRERT